MGHRISIWLISGLLLAGFSGTAFHFFGERTVSVEREETAYEADLWMHVFQHERKVGYNHTRLRERAGARFLTDVLFLRMNAMGHVQDMNLTTRSLLKTDWSIRTLDFEIMTDRPLFALEGEVRDHSLSLRMMGVGAEERMELPLAGPVYLPAAVPFAVAASAPSPGAAFVFDVFNPSELAVETTEVRILPLAEDADAPVKNVRYRLRATTRGLSRDIWIDDQGQILREEGILGFLREKGSQYEVRFGTRIMAGEDIAASASVPSDQVIDAPGTVSELQIRITGLPDAASRLSGGRQAWRDDLLVVMKENIDAIQEHPDGEALTNLEQYLAPTPFIQSDHHRIQSLAAEIVGTETNPTKKVQRLVDWIREHVAPQPVLTVPDALSVAARLMGDCNDHAVLLAALARAVDVPAGIEAGLAYSGGRFYYHAWNRVHVGAWVTVDALTGQFPAPVTHIRLVGGPDIRQAELIGFISRLGVEIVVYR